MRKGNPRIRKSVPLKLARRWVLVCLTFLWEDLISVCCQRREMLSLRQRHFVSINMVKVAVGSVWTSEENTFLWSEYRKTDLLWALLGFLPRSLLIRRAACEQVPRSVLSLRRTARFNDALLLARNSWVTVRIPDCSPSYHPQGAHIPFF